MIDKINDYFNEFLNGTKTMFKEFFKKETNKKQRANMWTFSRLIASSLVVPISLIAVITSSTFLFGLAASITGFGAITDYFDGKSARKYNSSSEYGKLLDQITDKIFSLMIGISLSLFNPLYLLTLLGEGLISGINLNYKIKNEDLEINSTQIGRIKQWPLCTSLALGFLSPINGILLGLSNVSIIVTFIMQILTANSYIKQNNGELKKIDINKKFEVLTEQNDYDETKKIKTLELAKNYNNIELNNEKTQTRKHQYQALRNVLVEVIDKKLESENLEMKLKK